MAQATRLHSWVGISSTFPLCWQLRLITHTNRLKSTWEAESQLQWPRIFPMHSPIPVPESSRDGGEQSMGMSPLRSPMGLPMAH